LVTDNGGANNNTALGFNALNSVVSGAANTAVGHSAAKAFTALGGTFIGADAGKNGAGFNFSTAVGYSALSGPLTGGNNTALGAYAISGASTTTAQANICVGMYAGTKLTTGSFNTFVGSHIGNSSLCTTGTNNTTLGNTANPSSATVSNEITLGNASIATLRCQQTSITALSDRRDKKDIVPLELGLDFVNSLNPVKFTWNTRDGAKVGRTGIRRSADRSRCGNLSRYRTQGKPRQTRSRTRQTNPGTRQGHSRLVSRSSNSKGKN
jgi:hypothetical protein